MKFAEQSWAGVVVLATNKPFQSQLPEAAGYDLIGDIHGCAHTLKRLLFQMDYRKSNGVWRHPERKVIFLGDIVDRGPRIRESLELVYSMVQAGEAVCIMGNHEHNALTYCTPAPEGFADDYLRSHNPRHTRLIKETLEQFETAQDEWAIYLDWFKTLPLYLETDQFRVVHATWNDRFIRTLQEHYQTDTLTDELLIESVQPESFGFRLMEHLTRGSHIRLPDGVQIYGGDGFSRRTFRTHFWAEDPVTYGDVIFQPDNLPGCLEDQPLSALEKEQLLYYSRHDRPLFIGHYWCEGVPALVTPNIACLDYSAVKYGKLACYRFSGETQLDASNFVWISVDRDWISNDTST